MTLKLKTSIASVIRNETQTADLMRTGQPSQTNDMFDSDHVYFKRCNVTSMPEDFLNNDSSRDKLLELIENIEHIRTTQHEIDSIYLKLTFLLF